MIVMNKYCKSKWDRTRPAYTIREKKYRRIEELKNTSKSVSSVSQKEKTK